MSYFDHLEQAIRNALKLELSSLVLMVHGYFPFLFEHTASRLIKEVLDSFPKKNQKTILVRFNTKWESDSQKRQWRILINGLEHLAHHVTIKVPCQTVQKAVGTEEKFHFLCFGDVTWNDTEATITG